MHLSSIISTPQKQKQFAGKGITTVEELQRFFPRKYLDYTRITYLDTNPKLPVTEGAFELIAHSLEDGTSQKGIPYLRLNGADAVSGATVTIFWFHQTMKRNFLCDILPAGRYFVAGKAEYSYTTRSHTIMAPAIFLPFQEDCKRIYPIYSKIPKMSDAYLTASIQKALDCPVEEPYPPALAKHFGLPSLRESILELHRPTSQEKIDKALQRQKFDVLLEFAIQLKRANTNIVKNSPYLVKERKISKKIQEDLPYPLTKDQIQIIVSITDNMSAGNRVNALIQGDVGCGKTIVAFLLMFAIVENGYQCALMAPSRVLAQQHYEDIRSIAEKYGIKAVLYCSADMKKREQKALLKDIKDGTAQIIVGTHALLSEQIEFQNLALTVTDEEHKFGVLQRQTLQEKANQGVHCITMSATPIPRSLAKVLYGDETELYTIHTMPKGRLPVKTTVVSEAKQAMKIVAAQVKMGHQAFVVCPMIDPSEKTEGVASVREITHAYTDYFSSMGEYANIAVLTGRTSKEETQTILEDFRQKKTDILVATTVVEVGVNVPNATVIVVHNAERFGLSALHQLRGRVGRSQYPSCCVLVSPEEENERLKIMESSGSGFAIAQADLKLRGPGEWLGSAQSGKDCLAVQLMIAYPKAFAVAKHTAEIILQYHAPWPIAKAQEKEA